MHSESSYTIYRHFYNWFWVKVAFPLVCLLLIFVFYMFADFGLSSFIAAFAHGEILVFAAILLIELSFEGDELTIERPTRFDAWVDKALPIMKLVAFALICLFGFIRYDVMRITGIVGHGIDNDSLEFKLVAYCVLSLAVGATCVCIAIYACFAYCEHELARRIEVLTG